MKIILKSQRFGRDTQSEHVSIRAAAMSAYQEYYENTARPCRIEQDGVIVWENRGFSLEAIVHLEKLSQEGTR